jgi:NAD(P)-dependent dehydrogenase (short-subunit alcohol dehydrogenase family)
VSRISHRVIVVTGASSGIGAATAQALAARGARVCLIARRAAELEQVRGEILAAGGEAFAYSADLAVDAEVDACAAAILKDHGRVDVLVNNAGRSIRRPIIKSLDRDHDYQRLMQINYFAAVRLSLRLLPGMLERHDGHIINVTSMGVQLATPMFSAYIASKSALEGFSRCLAAEMADRGVAVTLVRFPLVKTPMTAPTAIYKKIPQMDVNDAAQWIVRAVEKRPARVGRLGGTVMETAGVLLPGTTALWTGRALRFASRWLQKRVDEETAPLNGDAAPESEAAPRAPRSRPSGKAAPSPKGPRARR